MTDTTRLTTAMREATDGLEPPEDFTAAVLRGGRRRRTRGRVAIGAVVTGVVAAAVVTAAAVPHRLAAPPPGGQPEQPKLEQILVRSGGDLIHDRDTVRLARTAWQESVDTTYLNDFGYLSQRQGEPHVYWAGTTPAGPSAIVTQTVVLPTNDNVAPTDRGRQVVAVGLLVTSPGAKRELELVGVQLDGDQNGHGGYFLFPDNRTVLGIEPDDDGMALFVSPVTTIGTDGRSRRPWTELPAHDGVSYVRLPHPANPRNVRLVVSEAGGDPNAGEQKIGAHIPLLLTTDYLAEREGIHVDNDLSWPSGSIPVGEKHKLPRSPANLFGTALRESGLPDPTSFEDTAGRWLVVAGMADGRTMIVGSYQELDNPAYLFTVLVRADGSVEKVTRGPVADPDAVLPVGVRLPDGQGWVVAAVGHQLRHNAGGAWSAPVADAALVPDASTDVRVDGQDVTLPR